MTDLRNKIFYLILLIGLTACHKEMSPITSGILTYSNQTGSFNKKDISSNEIQKLSLWLDKHSNDWSGCYATPTGPLFSVELKHANGQASTLMLLSDGGTLRASHLDGSNKSDQPCALMTVNKQEITELRAMLFLEK